MGLIAFKVVDTQRVRRRLFTELGDDPELGSLGRSAFWRSLLMISGLIRLQDVSQDGQVALVSPSAESWDDTVNLKDAYYFDSGRVRRWYWVQTTKDRWSMNDGDDPDGVSPTDKQSLRISPCKMTLVEIRTRFRGWSRNKCNFMMGVDIKDPETLNGGKRLALGSVLALSW